MNSAPIQDSNNTNGKNISGDGDASSIRQPVPSSRKFTPTTRKPKDMKSKLELALKELQTPNKKQGLRTKVRFECSSVDTPVRISSRKGLKPANHIDEIQIYCSPRESALCRKFPEDAARVVLRYLLLNSWRKSRSRCHELESQLFLKEDKMNQLNMQINVLQNLRKSESSRREEISKKYQEIQKDFDDIIKQNVALRNYIECLDKEKFNLTSELERVKEKIKYYQQEIEEKNNVFNTLSQKLQKENDKLKKTAAERRNAIEQNHKLESIISIQKENLENLKSCVEALQISKLDMCSKLEKSQQTCKNHLEQLRILNLENTKNKSKISTYEMEKEELSKQLNLVRMQLEIALNNCEELNKTNESIQMDYLQISKKYEEEKRFFFNLMKRGMSSTYGMLKYLADKLVPALQANFVY